MKNKLKITNKKLSFVIFSFLYFINVNFSYSFTYFTEFYQNNSNCSNLNFNKNNFPICDEIYINETNYFNFNLNDFNIYNNNLSNQIEFHELSFNSSENYNDYQDLTYLNSDYDIEFNKDTTTDTDKLFERIDIKDFKYGNTPRFTITGNLPYKETHLNYLNTGLVVGGLTTLFILQHIAQANTIWKDKSKFRILEDGSYALYADKPGHIIGTYLASYAMSEALMTSGVDWESSVVTGGLLGLAYNTYVEVLDGYGSNFGFSPTDMYANVFGAGLFIGQYYSPFLQNITPKFTYFPSNWFGQRKRQPHDFFIDDYSSHTLWLSFNIHILLPDSYKQYWPNWLELSLGYAARNLTVAYDPTNIYYHDPNVSYKNNDVEGDPKFIIALDYNLVKLLPDGGSFWNWAKQTLNFFKLPAPAIEIDIKGRTKFFLLYPFPIN